MEDGKLKIILQGVLNEETIQVKCSHMNWVDTTPRGFSEMLDIIHSALSLGYDIKVKPKIKIVKYQTRLYSIGLEHKTVYQWCSLTNSKTEKDLEDSYKSLKWLQPTQEHTFEYEETE